MVMLKETFDIKEEIPTTRFWLMTKLKLGWNKRWDIYISGLEKNLAENMICDLSGDEASRAKKAMVRTILEKLERSAWATMPPEFLKSMKVDRVLRH